MRRTEELARSLQLSLARVWELMQLADDNGVVLPPFEVRLGVESAELDGRPGTMVSSWYCDRHCVRAHRTHTELQRGKPRRVRHLPPLELSYPEQGDGIEWLLFARKLDGYLQREQSDPLPLDHIMRAMARTEARWGEQALRALRAALTSVPAPHWLLERFCPGQPLSADAF